VSVAHTLTPPRTSDVSIQVLNSNNEAVLLPAGPIMASLDHIELAINLTLTDKEPPKSDKQNVESDSEFEFGEFHQHKPVLIVTENAM